VFYNKNVLTIMNMPRTKCLESELVIFQGKNEFRSKLKNYESRRDQKT